MQLKAAILASEAEAGAVGEGELDSEPEDLLEGLRRFGLGGAAPGPGGRHSGCPAGAPSRACSGEPRAAGGRRSSSSSGPRPSAAGSCPAAGAGSSGPSAATAPAGSFTPARAQRGRFYCVTRAPVSHHHLLGVHFCVWDDLLRRLSPGGVRHSGVHQRRFDTWEEAAGYWFAEGWAAPIPSHNA